MLINNASIFEPSSIKDTSSALLLRHLNVNLITPFLLSRDFAKKCQKGHIINVLDTRITSNRTTYAAYSISKKALAAFTKMSAHEFGPGIRVNAIAPGLILSPHGLGDDYLKKLAKDIPLKTKGDVENILQTVDFLLENKFLTGQTIFCDGGEHLKTPNGNY